MTLVGGEWVVVALFVVPVTLFAILVAIARYNDKLDGPPPW
jgi:hypothetical protein